MRLHTRTSTICSIVQGVDGWGVTLKGIMGLVVVFGAAICALRHYIEVTTVRSTTADLPTSSKKEKKDKPKMGVGESFAFLANSTYIRCIATLVVSYGIAINIVEVTWKSKLKAQYPNPNDYTTFMGNFSTVTGALTARMIPAALSSFVNRSSSARRLVAIDCVMRAWLPLQSRAQDVLS